MCEKQNVLNNHNFQSISHNTPPPPPLTTYFYYFIVIRNFFFFVIHLFLYSLTSVSLAIFFVVFVVVENGLVLFTFLSDRQCIVLRKEKFNRENHRIGNALHSVDKWCWLTIPHSSFTVKFVFLITDLDWKITWINIVTKKKYISHCAIYVLFLKNTFK